MGITFSKASSNEATVFSMGVSADLKEIHDTIIRTTKMTRMLIETFME